MSLYASIFFRVDAYQQFSFGRISFTIRLGLVRSHIPAADSCGPFEQRAGVFGKGDRTLYHDEGVRGNLIVYRYTHSRIALHIQSFYGFSPCSEHKYFAVEVVSYGDYVRASIFSYCSQLSGLRAIEKESPIFLSCHLLLVIESLLIKFIRSVVEGSVFILFNIIMKWVSH